MKKTVKIAGNALAFPANTYECFMISIVTAITKD